MATKEEVFASVHALATGSGESFHVGTPTTPTTKYPVVKTIKPFGDRAFYVIFEELFNAETETQKAVVRAFVLKDELNLDGNHGIPEDYFEKEYVFIEVIPSEDRVEWVPDMGPAPIWHHTYSVFADYDAMFNTFNAWVLETF